MVHIWLKESPLTNHMSSEKVLELNIIVLLPSIFINKHSLKVVSEKASVGSQVEFEIPENDKQSQT